MICPCDVASFATHRFSSTINPVSLTRIVLISAADAATLLKFSRASSELGITGLCRPCPSCARSGVLQASNNKSTDSIPTGDLRNSQFTLLRPSFVLVHRNRHWLSRTECEPAHPQMCALYTRSPAPAGVILRTAFRIPCSEGSIWLE